ncbi:hypothetical protein M406DRAFT_70440 [Cryphonectria parasitica EP155]|uniref:Rad21/Rec8-like protein N-terminal domain-containing protein n=1 Tax=Cryphonectria parasitica (strain ATCC 38755 / EP155) TaxID=660469 RepID=A0A9P4Y1Q9_CRYP1|nr:uncharacterized protein M406DRAFT_70440 [Cryphonectria parasitica EP155]KAF3765058.1 hypothetical protein M406DRAFT_70440 [Cryphonectria parasitica EP155]
MFYSHEILGNPQHGVATVWLVANSSNNGNGRQLHRKIIEKVNVPQACDTIEKPPGAPIALRLQGSLLYGVSGVFNKHSTYLLTDVEKVCGQIRASLCKSQKASQNAIDPKAGKAKRHQLMLGDDPDFVPDPSLPTLEFDKYGDLVIPGLQTNLRPKYLSQDFAISPADQSSASTANTPFINLNILRTPSQRSINLASPVGKGKQVLRDGRSFLGDFDFGFDEDIAPEPPIQIDSDGNIIEMPEPELPAYPSDIKPFSSPSGIHSPGVYKKLRLAQPAKQTPTRQPRANQTRGDDAFFVDDDGLTPMYDDVPEEIPIMDGATNNNAQSGDIVSRHRSPCNEPMSSQSAHATQPKEKKRKPREPKLITADVETQVRKTEFKSWSDDYVARMVEGHVKQDKAKFQKGTTFKARNTMFDAGIGGVGSITSRMGRGYELAEFLSGDRLMELVLGDTLDAIKRKVEKEIEKERQGGRQRRSASLAFTSDEEDKNGKSRRVRLRADDGNQGLEPDQQHGRGQPEKGLADSYAVLMDDELPEMGRKHLGSALSDKRLSVNVPWNRPSSTGLTSAANYKKCKVGSHTVDNSPLDRQTAVNHQSTIHLSDSAMPVSRAGRLIPSQQVDTFSPFSYNEFGLAVGVSPQETNTSQSMPTELDGESQNFLAYVKRVAADRGEEDDYKNQRWIEFDDLMEVQDKTKEVAAQAFFQVLKLAGKGQIQVNQERSIIHIGVKDRVQEVHLANETEDHARIESSIVEVQDGHEVQSQEIQGVVFHSEGHQE